MFKGLRFRLTATYIAAALGLVLLMGLGTYGLLRYYFQSDNDAALQYRVALEYETLGIELPPDLEAAKEDWASRHIYVEAATALPPGQARKARSVEVDELGDEGGPPWMTYPDSELAPQFVLHLDSNGKLIADASTAEDELPTPIAEGYEAAVGAPDIRTATLADGSEVRVATYPLPASVVSSSQPIAYVQAGRLVADQNHVLGQILLTVLLSCGGAAIVVGLASWYLAGRSLRPARKAWEQQQVFVANASHELRTPVTLIRASAEFALRQYPAIETVAERSNEGASTDPNIAEILTDVITESDHLSRLVDDLVLLSRIDAGKIELEVQPLSVQELFSDVSRSFGRLAEQKGVTFRSIANEGTVLTDRTRTRQVILILLDNALQHTSPGGTISLDARADGRRVNITVTDTGTGIAPEDLPRVFDRFYQARSATCGNRGSGLGLSIAQSLVETLKGRIDIESRLGEGTQATLSLPRAAHLLS
jgi:signal transduction histidine kinase